MQTNIFLFIGDECMIYLALLFALIFDMCSQIVQWNMDIQKGFCLFHHLSWKDQVEYQV